MRGVDRDPPAPRAAQCDILTSYVCLTEANLMNLHQSSRASAGPDRSPDAAAADSGGGDCSSEGMRPSLVSLFAPLPASVDVLQFEVQFAVCWLAAPVPRRYHRRHPGRRRCPS